MLNLASIGAALMVAAIAIEPSLQQIPTFPLASVDSNVATTPRSYFYNELDRGEVLESNGGINTVVSAGMRGAVYSGVFVSNPVGTILRSTCPSGNCTWPEFSSIGVCHLCQNITSELYCKRTLPGQENKTPRFPNSMRVDRIGISATQWMSIAVYASTAFNQKLVDQSILNLTIIALPPLSQDAITNISATAFECMLYPWVKRYKASMRNGNYEEADTETWPQPNTTIEDNPKIGTVFGCVGHGYYRMYEQCEVNTTADSLNGNITLRPPGQDESFAIKLDARSVLRI